MQISKRQILKTTLMPGIWPRLKQLFGSGFATLAYLIAVVYNTVRILPSDHPFLKAENIGTFGIRQAIAEAANHIKPSKSNIDQIIIFFSVIAALVIMAIQFVLLIVAMFIPRANAASLPTTIEGFFVTPNPQEDIAYRMLDMVFGVPDLFGSKEPTETSIHVALHSLFEFYTLGILIVGCMILIYLIVAIVAETAQSGIPFGQRFNKSWAPIRLVLFFGLLIPISYGLNAGQYITLTSAKLGSALASTGWVMFNAKIAEANETLTGRTEQNVAIPNAVSLNHLPAFMMVAKTCKFAYDKVYNEAEDFPPTWEPSDGVTGVQAWAVTKQETIGDDGVSYAWVSEKMEDTTFQNMSALSNGTSDIFIVFGVKDEVDFERFKASIAPVCGELVLHVTDVNEPGSARIHTGYYSLVQTIWTGVENINTYSRNYVRRYINVNRQPAAQLPPENYPQRWETYLTEYMEGDGTDDGLIAEAVEAQIEDGDWQMPQQMRDYGWAGAGIWYNKIAQQNGALITALQNVPMAYLYPQVMEKVRDNKEQSDRTPNNEERFTPEFSAGAVEVPFIQPREGEIAMTLNTVFRFWEDRASRVQEQVQQTDNPILDVINVLLGTEGLFEICKNTDVHPLAQLSMLGKSLLDSSIRSFAASGLLSIGSIMPTPFSATMNSAASFFGIFAGIGLLIGFVLFYVLPFLPFLYFFFAVGNWVKSIFEAIVAVPLWCLAHLRIDGEGIPGDAAIGGYYLIFEIFIRPILIVFGLLAAVTIFAAMVKVLNQTFYLVITNLSGHDPMGSMQCFQDGTTPGQQAVGEYGRASLKQAYRGPLDEFFFTIVYTILVYMIGTTCFKLIDQVPDEILRWINAEIPAFDDGTKDSAEGLMKYVAIGGGRFGSQLGSSLSEVGGGIRQSVLQFTQRQ
jgi:conjugal transfer/type IV secretion protein DotA/TraY